jgi:hypothetical protein
MLRDSLRTNSIYNESVSLNTWARNKLAATALFGMLQTKSSGVGPPLPEEIKPSLFRIGRGCRPCLEAERVQQQLYRFLRPQQ